MNSVATARLGPRRVRGVAPRRRLVREGSLEGRQLVLPLFVVPGRDQHQPIEALPGHARRSVDRLVEHVATFADHGLGGVLLFGVPAEKDPSARAMRDPHGPLASGLAALRAEFPDLVLFADVCLCAATDHGHCGVVHGTEIDHRATLRLLAETAVVAAQAGADFVAPSAMADGQVAAIRAALDQAGKDDTGILSYATKFASAWYGPFRQAAGSAPTFGDRRGYQLDPANLREAVREARLDAAEGADLLMVKPAGLYLDVIRAVREATDLPLAAYQVSGEYASVVAAAERGWLDEREAALESLIGIRRAGADIVISYWTLHALSWLRGGPWAI
jgi:porphobilinogen synthase